MTTTPDAHVANYVLQVNMVYRPNANGNYLGSFNIWKKGGLFGHGDELMRFCPAHGCLGIIDYSFYLTEEEADKIEYQHNVSKWPESVRKKHENWYDEMVPCPKCDNQAPRSVWADSYGFNMDINKISGRMVDIFRVLDSDADIYLVRTKEDLTIHKARRELKEKAAFDRNKYERLMSSARDREQVLYTNSKILKDAVAGGLDKKFKAMLRA